MKVAEGRITPHLTVGTRERKRPLQEAAQY